MAGRICGELTNFWSLREVVLFLWKPFPPLSLSPRVPEEPKKFTLPGLNTGSFLVRLDCGGNTTSRVISSRI